MTPEAAVGATRLDGVESELAGLVDGVAERFVPETMHGQLIEAEHLSRYRWAAPLAAGKRVLDAGCGTAYGSAMLAEAGARQVVGVDTAADVLAAVRPRMPGGVRLLHADVVSLPFEDASFDVVVCFEAIEHVDDAEAVIDEFARVLAEDGVLAVSSPNREVYVPGNPHHRHEFVPDELAEMLSRRFTNVRLYRQDDWITSAVLDDGLHTFEGDEPVEGVVLRKAAGELGRELYTLALASGAVLPEPPPTATMTGAAEIKAVAEAGERLAKEQEALSSTYRRVDKEHRDLNRRTARAEQAAADAQARVTELGTKLLDAEASVARTRLTLSRQAADLEPRLRELEEAKRRIEGLESELQDAQRTVVDMQATKVWRLSARLWRVRDTLLLRRRGSAGSA